MKSNPFRTARRNKRIKTIGQCIEALVDCFSEEGSGDTIGSYILERAAEEAEKRRPARKEELDTLLKEIDERRAKWQEQDRIRLEQKQGFMLETKEKQ